jgi:hypothetical protein
MAHFLQEKENGQDKETWQAKKWDLLVNYHYDIFQLN